MEMVIGDPRLHAMFSTAYGLNNHARYRETSVRSLSWNRERRAENEKLFKLNTNSYWAIFEDMFISYEFLYGSNLICFDNDNAFYSRISNFVP